ncbi:MAG: hypothetical protein HQK76_16120 [Desulfobacterales bacterium]|nr:hypothetical protein [Desulfobacterales bacterium]
MEENKSTIINKDHTDLILNVFEIIESKCNSFIKHELEDYDSKYASIKSIIKHDNPAFNYVVLSEDTALELGPPKFTSLSCVLFTNQNNTVKDGIWIKGTDFPNTKKQAISFAQIIMLELDKDSDATNPKIQTLKYLSNKIPGYMPRNIPGKIWVRIHKNLIDKGFSLVELGSALISEYKKHIKNIKSISIILISDEPDCIKKFEDINLKANKIYEENIRSKLDSIGAISCDSLNCTSCDEKIYCDTIKSIALKKGKK